MEKLNFKLSQFEGPLDLLLFLISKHKLDILNIEISQLLKQYMEYMETTGNQDLDVKSEFLEMAARLINIKTLMLLPRHESEGEELKR
ncbi:MAG: segregation/condensation protein A, partial [Oscillospiraceae bacterium]